ncbi:DUF2076 domain-containing protein [Commensalibacter oyaizuii]|uniref:DUF2076 domain-containing protein n=1 Tax=Commensalibacter oyaizuii TaxID=3043873 RepID=A0ABT6Q0F3_9PROT|nr:DUF2076 domain-containing protein [Commensalibacter sp. TBRC 16381]MDI2090582.1 DUF2076 domain-containing protein [Commensalibacter sp. TBRC 16381]
MNNEERELINKFFERVGGKSSAQPGSVPATNQLPPLDPEADQLITDNFRKYPEAGYRVTQMAVVQEAALVEAQNRIRQLEWQLQQTSQQLQQAQQQQQSQQQRPAGGGFLGGLFGGNNRQQSQGPQQNQMPPPGWGAPNQQQYQGQPGRPYPGQQGPYGGQQGYAGPPPNYPPGYQQGMFNRGGSGFLGSALTTAAGVAGGMFAYNAISGLFSGGHGGAAAGGMDPSAGIGAADPFSGAADPFAGAGTSVDPGFDAGAGGIADESGWGGAGTDAGWDNSGADAGWGDNADTADTGSDWGGGDDSGWGDDSF